MDVHPREADAQRTLTYLVTGANSGLGFAICCRLLDEFLHTRPQSESLHLLYSTRDTTKSDDTRNRLNAHLHRTLRAADKRVPGASRLLESRIKLEGVLVDLTKLLTVKALALQLRRRKQRLDGVVWNAGIAGWSRLSWSKAIWDVTCRPVVSTTYPEFMVCDVGALAPRQLGGYGKVHTFEEPRLGQVFTANVFGHYLLTHWLSPLFTPASRIVWVSSVAALRETLRLDDIQGVGAHMAYEGTKRLTDLLVLSSELSATRKSLDSFLPSPPSSAAQPEQARPRPKMFLTHPGVIATNISGLPAILTYAMLMVLYLVRLIGSPWHPISTYKGAISAVYTLLSPASQLPALEADEGKGKWGSACSPFGEERVARTEVDGWGYTGNVREGEEAPRGAVRAKWPNYAGAVTKEGREEFEVMGQDAWTQMEELRKEWEARLGRIEVDEGESGGF